MNTDPHIFTNGTSTLAHYGVKGMRWGIRKDKNKSFESAVNSVRHNLSNEPSPITKQSASMSAVKRRSGITNDKDAALCVDMANLLYDSASKREPQITKDVISSVVNTNAKMYGLQNRMKQPTSLAGKIGTNLAISDNINDASSNIHDVIRYTICSEDSSYTNNYKKISATLAQKGYTETRCKNYFERYVRQESMHKSIQCNYRSPDGQYFEIQYQTPSSQAAKELKIPLYEERRKSSVSKSRARILEAKMRDLAEQVSTPRGVSRIKEH